jgi:hypothetical protein
MVISSAGLFRLAWLFASKSPDMFAYRDALYTYLHFQYNGFFTLAVFALFFHKLEAKISAGAKKNIFGFSLWLCISIIPSLFLTYLWRNPNEIYQVIAIAGSITFLGFVTLFIFTWLAYYGFLNIRSAFTRWSLGIFAAAVILNEAVLMVQGLGAMFIQSIWIFPWLLWGASILLFVAAIMIAASRVLVNRPNA